MILLTAAVAFFNGPILLHVGAQVAGLLVQHPACQQGTRLAWRDKFQLTGHCLVFYGPTQIYAMSLPAWSVMLSGDVRPRTGILDMADTSVSQICSQSPPSHPNSSQMWNPCPMTSWMVSTASLLHCWQHEAFQAISAAQIWSLAEQLPLWQKHGIQPLKIYWLVPLNLYDSHFIANQSWIIFHQEGMSLPNQPNPFLWPVTWLQFFLLLVLFLGKFQGNFMGLSCFIEKPLNSNNGLRF